MIGVRGFSLGFSTSSLCRDLRRKELAGKIESLSEVITQGKTHEEIRWLRKPPNPVFTLKSDPGLVFKGGIHGQDCKSYLFLRQIWQADIQLFSMDRLVIPHATSLELSGGREVLVEEELPIDPDAAYNADDLTKGVEHLTQFILLTGIHGIKPGHLPILKPDGQSVRRIGILDLRTFDNYDLLSEKGLCGTPDGRERGLIGMLGKKSLIEAAVKATLLVHPFHEGCYNKFYNRLMERRDQRLKELTKDG